MLKYSGLHLCIDTKLIIKLGIHCFLSVFIVVVYASPGSKSGKPVSAAAGFFSLLFKEERPFFSG
jgi:hypothetical protein